MLKKNEAINAGLAGYLEEYHYYIQSVRNSNSNTSKNVNRMWRNVNAGVYLIDPCEDPYMRCDDDGDDNPFVSTTQTWVPLLQTAWSQGCGYNDLLSSVYTSTGTNCGKVFTGCVATAMAQIIRYWQHPNNYNWSAMP